MNRYRAVSILTIGITLSCLTPIAQGTDGKGIRKDPFYGAWIHLHRLFDYKDGVDIREASIEHAIDDCARSGLTSVMPFAITGMGKAQYPSVIVPERVYRDWDPLGAVIRESRERDLGVYISVPLLVCGHEDPAGILAEHPEWAVLDREGKRLGYICGGNSEARKWLVSVVQELVRMYKPDGIVLDYLRYPNKPVDVDPETRARFLKEAGVESYDIADRQDEKWQRFKEKCLIELAGLIRKGIDEIEPGTELGIYSWGPQVAKDHYVSQDWITMTEKGYLNLINVSGYMYEENYGEDYLQEFEARMKEAASILPKGNSKARLAFVLGVITSHGRLESADEIETYLRIARTAGIPGCSVFTLSYLQPFIDDLLKNGPLNEPKG